MTLTLNEYQEIAYTTAIYKDKILYPTLGLAGEAGEVAEKIKKLLRDKGGVENMTEEDRSAVAKEVGDVLWYCAAVSTDLGIQLEDVARINIGKLLARKEAGTISGSGDDR